MDALGRILRSLRIKSTRLSRARLRGEWGVHTHGAPGLLMHGVVAGRAVLVRDAEPETAVTLEAGDVVVLPRGEAHALLARPGAAARPITELPRRGGGAATILEVGFGADATRLVCGLVTLDHPAADEMVSLLPPLLVAKGVEGAKARWVESTLALLDEELTSDGDGARVRSLCDGVFVHAVLTAAASESTASSILAAAKDERIGKALALVHENPSRDWTAPELASSVGMSRTRFFERFSELVGEPPAKYVARWRVQAAADLMRSGQLSTAEIAERVGYSSEDALARVFRRHLGMTPGQWRRNIEAGTS